MILYIQICCSRIGSLPPSVRCAKRRSTSSFPLQEYQAIVDAEWTILYGKLEKIVASGAKVVLSKLPIGDVATQYFADRCVQVCGCACVSLCTCMCMRVLAYMHVCACACVRVLVYMHVYACACIHACVCVCMRACACVHACVCVCMHVCACVAVHACVRLIACAGTLVVGGRELARHIYVYALLRVIYLFQGCLLCRSRH